MNMKSYDVKYRRVVVIMQCCQYTSINVCCLTLSLNKTDLRLESSAWVQPMLQATFSPLPLLSFFPFIIQALQIRNRSGASLQYNVNTNNTCDMITFWWFLRQKSTSVKCKQTLTDGCVPLCYICPALLHLFMEKNYTQTGFSHFA